MVKSVSAIEQSIAYTRRSNGRIARKDSLWWRSAASAQKTCPFSSSADDMLQLHWPSCRQQAQSSPAAPDRHIGQ